MRNFIEVIFAGVRNVPLASLRDTAKTCRRRTTSRIGRDLKINMPRTGKQMWWVACGGCPLRKLRGRS